MRFLEPNRAHLDGETPRPISHPEANRPQDSSLFQRCHTDALDDAQNADQKLEALLEQEPGRDLALAEVAAEG